MIVFHGAVEAEMYQIDPKFLFRCLPIYARVHFPLRKISDPVPGAQSVPTNDHKLHGKKKVFQINC